MLAATVQTERPMPILRSGASEPSAAYTREIHRARASGVRVEAHRRWHVVYHEGGRKVESLPLLTCQNGESQPPDVTDLARWFIGHQLHLILAGGPAFVFAWSPSEARALYKHSASTLAA